MNFKSHFKAAANRAKNSGQIVHSRIALAAGRLPVQIAICDQCESWSEEISHELIVPKEIDNGQWVMDS